MKTLFKVLALSILLTAFSALAFGQEDKGAALQAEYTKFRTEIKGKCGERAPAIVTGKKIIETYEPTAAEIERAKNETTPDKAAKDKVEFYNLNKEVIDYVKKKVGEIEKADPGCKRIDEYNAALKAKNWANVFSTGKAIIAAEGPNSPLTLDVMLDLASVGFDQSAVQKVDTYNADTMTYAKQALDRLNAGGESSTKQYGAGFPFKTKEAAQSWMNYIIGWQMYNKTNQKKEALSYFYKASQIGTEKKNDPNIYTNIGSYYFDEAVRLNTEYTEKRKANNNEDNDETRQLLGLARGTADRASDAFGRAYKIAAADPKLATMKAAVAKTLTDLYKFRFNLADAKQADVDTYVNNLTSKAMPDPSTPVTPVVEATPTTTTTSTTTPNPTNSTTTMTTPTPTPTSTTSGKTTPTTTKTTPTTKTTTTVKKPVKKKGTR